MIMEGLWKGGRRDLEYARDVDVIVVQRGGWKKVQRARMIANEAKRTNQGTLIEEIMERNVEAMEMSTMMENTGIEAEMRSRWV